MSGTREEKIKKLLICECIALFEQLRRSGLKSVYCGAPPERLILHVGHWKDGDRPAYKKLPKKGTEAFIYSCRGLEAADFSRKRSTERSGVYYKEAYAEAAFDGCGQACIKMDYGPRYTSAYVYDVIDGGRECRLSKGRLQSGL